MIPTYHFFDRKIITLLSIFILLINISVSNAQDTTSLKQQLKVAKADTGKVKLFNQLCNLLEDINPVQALSYASQAHELAKKIKYNDGIARALINIAALQMYLGENDKALKSNQSLYQLCKKNGDEVGMVSSLNNIGAVYQRTSKYVEAAKYTFRALHIAEKVKDSSLIAVCHSNIATIFTQQHDFEKAIIYAKKADFIFKKINEPSNEAKNLETLGNCYAFNGNTVSAKPYYTAALNIYEKLGNEMGKALMYTQMVDCFADEPLKQIEYLQKAKAIWDKIAPLHINAIANTGNFGYTLFQIVQDPAKLALVQRKLGLNKAQMLADANKYFKKCIATSKQGNQTELISLFTIEYAKFCEYIGDYKEALTNLKLHYKAQDSLHSQESKNKIANLEAQFAFQKKEEKYKQAQALSKIKTQQIYLYAGLVVILMITIFIYFLNRYRIAELRMKNKLQKREAEEQAKELLHQSKLFESELKAIRSQMNPHFIFNVLNSIESYIMDNDKQTASRLIQKFASLSRLILENSTRSLVTADREWKALKLYTELEAMRYNNSFSFNFDADEALQLKTLLLPPMLIQPLIENAILHGIIVNPKPGAHIEVQLKKHHEGICITVMDNGNGIANAKKATVKVGIKEKSMGLASIRERINIINAQKRDFFASFKISSKTEGSGTIAEIFLPHFENALA
ncbi:tetratricopeptide repeat-containing sensor histidine kinase [Pedobacter xixiisoli]|uniref:Tetratricopeptide repeat-containing protein n=1 Tax=Pedobacter xixiisoli TaxID=1476464 RepID=A0A285ZX39_9SPHI|nr:histidine kinase [Pedobacter xixiisoli]SOD14222.1 Tetratricopeptide repeat-containing protein [Pedobacter xixiisoli]